MRHASAQRCEIALEVGAALVVTVTDDGRGLPEHPRAGVGLRSMSERAAELGGTLSISARPGGGTVVRASLPCASR